MRSLLCLPSNQPGPQPPQNMSATHQAPTPLTSLRIPVARPESPATTLRNLTSEQALAAKKAKHEQWASLTLRQTWSDEAFMRDHLRAAHLKVGSNLEPATVKRLRSLLRRVGVVGPDIQDCLGTSLAGYLVKNPDLPLWAALALILEATGGFTFGLSS